MSSARGIEWVRRGPNPIPGEEDDIEIRQVFESEDLTEMIRESERRRAGAKGG